MKANESSIHTALPSYRVFHMDWYRISSYFKVNLYSGNDFFSDVDRKISYPRNIATLKRFNLVSNSWGYTLYPSIKYLLSV